MSSRNTSPQSTTPTFAQLGVAAEICEALADDNIHHTFAIQELTLPLALDGKDLIGQARTGMGKTLGFGVPLLDRVFDDADIPELDGTPRALVIVPTRELAIQVGADLTRAARHTPVRTLTIYGGSSIDNQISQLERGVDVVIGTPGRLLDLAQRGNLMLHLVAICVLDEADEMLDLGFLPDIERIFQALQPTPTPASAPRNRRLQTMLFSATMPGEIKALTRKFQHKPIHIHAEDPTATATHTSTRQVVFQAHQLDKLAVVSRILQSPSREQAVVFTRTKRSAAFLAQDLAELGFGVAAVHGDLNQPQREKALHALRSGAVDVLIATDVAARGIDIDSITHVINYHLPDDAMTFVHRIGRTGRAGKTGTAVSLVGLEEIGKWRVINDELALDQPQPPEWFSTSPELADAFDLPAGISNKVGAPTTVIGVDPKKHRDQAQPRKPRQRSRR